MLREKDGRGELRNLMRRLSLIYVPPHFTRPASVERTTYQGTWLRPLLLRSCEVVRSEKEGLAAWTKPPLTDI